MAIVKQKTKGPGPREAALREMREKRADDLRARGGEVRDKIKTKVVARVKKRVANIKAKRSGRGR